ncbi:MAG: 16S rRNA (cytosine(967)-C(5))-methyltransferase RsmB [Myxococcales bacterium]|nr:16S rRNA (cytosine(967)-C(5))-methyltransferase RsmB [Myxococcales bacterium]
MPTSSRSIAFQILLRVERTDAYLNLALDAAFKATPGLTLSERALITELAYGVMRHQGRLDATIAAHATRPPGRLDPEIRVALRLGAYQLFLMRTKPHAAVHETVELVKALPRHRHAASFVNALLRAMTRKGALHEPDASLDLAERLAIECSLPTWLVERWVARLGPDAASALCRAQNETPRIDIRVDPRRVSREAFLASLAQAGAKARPSRISPIGIELETAGNVTALPGFFEGLFQVQDEAAQLVGLLPRVEKGMRILDACAAPGAKTCHLAQRLGDLGRVHAIDLHAHKLRRLEDESRRLGLDHLIETLTADASAPLPFDDGAFDLVLADLPCTGLGTLRRHPEIRYRRTSDDPARLAGLQRSIIRNLTRYLKPGGQLVYSVCSMEPEEGVAHLPFFESLGLHPVAPDSADTIDWPLDEGGMAIATRPNQHGCDGFFGVRLMRRTS